MNSIYTLRDIHNLLAKKYPKYPRWTYDIYERTTGQRRSATIEDFTRNMFDTTALVFDYKGEEYSLDVAVSNFSFVVYEDEPNIMGSGSTTREKDDFSSDWIELLLDENEEKYAKMLLRYSERHKKKIQSEAEQKIANFTAKVEAEAKRASSRYEDLSQKAKWFLPITDIVEVESELRGE